MKRTHTKAIEATPAATRKSKRLAEKASEKATVQALEPATKGRKRKYAETSDEAANGRTMKGRKVEVESPEESSGESPEEPSRSLMPPGSPVQAPDFIPARLEDDSETDCTSGAAQLGLVRSHGKNVPAMSLSWNLSQKLQVAVRAHQLLEQQERLPDTQLARLDAFLDFINERIRKLRNIYRLVADLGGDPEYVTGLEVTIRDNEECRTALEKPDSSSKTERRTWPSESR